MELNTAVHTASGIFEAHLNTCIRNLIFSRMLKEAQKVIKNSNEQEIFV